jgi:hypothetical protein
MTEALTIIYTHLFATFAFLIGVAAIVGAAHGVSIL